MLVADARSWTVLAAFPHPPHETHVGFAVLVALLSAGCYATSAVLQQRQASRQATPGTAALLRRLARQPVWWLAIVATVAGAALHVLALRLGPVSVVQPLGISTLVLALPLAAGLTGRRVARDEWCAAAAVVAGLGALLAIAPHHVRPPHISDGAILIAAACVVAGVLLLLAVAARLPGRAQPVLRAAAAAACFGTASAMARILITGVGSLALAGLVTVVCAGAGFAIAQLAYRDGGLGGPLATLTLIDPLVAVTFGIVLLGEPFSPSPLHVGLGLAGLVATVLGLRVLTRPEVAQPVAASAARRRRHGSSRAGNRLRSPEGPPAGGRGVARVLP